MSPRAALVLPLLLAGLEAQGSPAMIARDDPASSEVGRSFSSFAEAWVDRAVARGTRDSQAPRARNGSAGLVFTYRAVDEQFETGLRPTGRPGSPYVGVLHYTEHVYTCSDAKGSDCRITSSVPLTEVFRYRDGAWGY